MASMAQSSVAITVSVTAEKSFNWGCAGEANECLPGQYIHFEDLVNHVYATRREWMTVAARVTIP
jgi:hypothetical protein